MKLALVALLVSDYDDAIAWFTGTLSFALIEDTPLGDGKRWVIVAPEQGSGLLLALAKGEDQRAAIGNQHGGRVGFFLHTRDFARDHGRLRASGVEFVEEPRTEAYGLVAVFRDLYGNKWDLIQPSERD